MEVFTLFKAQALSSAGKRNSLSVGCSISPKATSIACENSVYVKNTKVSFNQSEIMHFNDRQVVIS